MLKQIEGLGEEVVAFEAEGRVSAEDYKNTLVPALDKVLEDGGRPRFLYVLGPSFERFELGAVLADTKVGLSHLTDFERIAVVSNHDWIEQGVRAFGVLVPCPVRFFPMTDLDEARFWIAEPVTEAVEVHVDREGSIASVHARLSGTLDRAAEEQLVNTLVEGIGDADEIRVLVEAGDFHGWRELRAFWQHIRFVLGHRRRIKRLAIVGDARWQRRLLSTARHVLRIDARFFEQPKLAEAKVWVAE